MRHNMLRLQTSTLQCWDDNSQGPEEGVAPVCPGAGVARVALGRVVSRAVTEHPLPGPGLYLLAGGGAAVITPPGHHLAARHHLGAAHAGLVWTQVSIYCYH